MSRPSKFQQAKPEIIHFFDKQSSSILSPSDMADILLQGQRYWKLPSSYGVKKFIEDAIKHIDLSEAQIAFPYRSYKRYIWKTAPKYELYLSFVKDSYFTHQTALFLHQLILPEPKTIYLNFEQSPKPRPKGKLSQEGIDIAFENRQRMTKNIATFNKDKIYLLNGKNSNKTGVIKLSTPHGNLDVTDLERTLIDITVRPDYTAGVGQILTAYKNASKKISTKKTLSTLKKLDFVYPYHQSIGFLLEQSGLNDPTLLKPFKDLGLNFDFYLTRQMEDPAYSEKWKLYYPKNLL